MPVHKPIFESTRGTTVESIHYGAAAVVDVSGKLLAWIGDPQSVTFLRSAAKPFQALPFIERGGARTFGLLPREIAQICASHTGSDMHVATVRGIQAKAGLRESDLQCGVHIPFDKAAADRLFLSGEKPTPCHHNCSGKHTGMLAHAKMRGLPLDTYLDLEHPIQQDILSTFAGMCELAPEEIHLGTDGCSAPNFAVPLYNAALGYARLCDPHDLPDIRAEACRAVTAAMMAHPEMVSGYGRFDTRLMQVGGGKIVVKGGAEGYQCAGLMPGALGAGSPGVGIALKVSDGDIPKRGADGEFRSRVRPAVMLEILRQLGALDESQLADLSGFGPVKAVRNWRELVVGESRPNFTLEGLQ
ncbi:MAG: asparaginase [Chloroflexi bacterium]|nr:asparaginase [Chloroflexota bacterium]